MLLKIGELAKRTGVTVRALRHYDEIGLLSPSGRSEGGFRLYGADDVGKLYRIQALSRLNLSLAEVARALAADGAAFPDIVARQIAFLDRQIAHAQSLRGHLADLQSRLDGPGGVAADDWIGALAQMSAASGYFDADERRVLAARRAAGVAEKAALVAALRQLMVQGATPDRPEAQALAGDWLRCLMDEVGGDEGLLMKYHAMHWNEDALHVLSGVDRAAMVFITHAMAHRRLAIYARYCSAAEIRALRGPYVEHSTAWPPLIAAVRGRMAAGCAPDDPAVRRLAAQWLALESAKAGGDLRLAAKLRHAFGREPALRFGSGIDRSLLDYLQPACHALRTNPIDDTQKEYP